MIYECEIFHAIMNDIKKKMNKKETNQNNTVQWY